MLYVPPAFKVDDIETLRGHIAAYPLATLITIGEGRPVISHVPMQLDATQGQFGVLRGHLARANPQVTESRMDCLATAVFHGPQAYVSPGWYPSKAEHGKVVPTWNYAVVHARGKLRFFDDAQTLRDLVDELTLKHESGFAKPWSTSDAPEPFIKSQLKGIIGFELVIEELEGKYKLSQNRPEQDREGVKAGLVAQSKPETDAVHRLMLQD